MLTALFNSARRSTVHTFASPFARRLMTSLAQPVFLPPVHRGMTELDRDSFKTSVQLLAARVPAAQTTTYSHKELKDYILRGTRLQTIVADPDMTTHRRVVLRTSDKSALPASLVESLAQAEIELVPHTLNLTYDYWTADQVLQAVLPENLLDESPTAFTQTGHLAHLNLRDEYLPHRHLIGQVILDKNKSLRTVVNKLHTIDNVYRNFAMEVLAGDEDFIVHTHEGGCALSFDFSKVYWNSRLQNEHTWLVDSFGKDDLVVDAFAGVGPFALPAGKKGCAVMASDLNPASAAALAANAKTNKLTHTVRTFNEDARAFIRRSPVDVWNAPFAAYTPPLSSKQRSRAARDAHKVTAAPADGSAPASGPTAAPTPTPAGPERKLIDHFVMNLPASAIEFLDAFNGLYRELYKVEGAREAVKAKGKLPMVHCYCFTKEVETAADDILARATEALGFPVTQNTTDYRLRFVRDVAPKKEMYCLEFRLEEHMVE